MLDFLRRFKKSDLTPEQEFLQKYLSRYGKCEFQDGKIIIRPSEEDVDNFNKEFSSSLCTWFYIDFSDLERVSKGKLKEIPYPIEYIISDMTFDKPVWGYSEKPDKLTMIFENCTFQTEVMCTSILGHYVFDNVHFVEGGKTLSGNGFLRGNAWNLTIKNSKVPVSELWVNNLNLENCSIIPSPVFTKAGNTISISVICDFQAKNSEIVGDEIIMSARSIQGTDFLMEAKKGILVDYKDESSQLDMIISPYLAINNREYQLAPFGLWRAVVTDQEDIPTKRK